MRAVPDTAEVEVNANKLSGDRSRSLIGGDGNVAAFGCNPTIDFKDDITVGVQRNFSVILRFHSPRFTDRNGVGLNQDVARSRIEVHGISIAQGKGVEARAVHYRESAGQQRGRRRVLQAFNQDIVVAAEQIELHPSYSSIGYRDCVRSKGEGAGNRSGRIRAA